MTPPEPSQDNRPPLPPTFVIVVGVLAVSTASIFIRYAQRDAPSLVIAAWRLTLASLVLAPVVYVRHRPDLRRLRRRDVLLALLSGAFLAVHFATWIRSLEYTTVASSVVLVTTTPLWVGLLSPLVLHENPTRAVVLGMALTLAGSAFVALGDSCSFSGLGLSCPPWAVFAGQQALLGDFLALVGAWAAAGYFMIGRRLRARTSLITYIFLTYGMAALVLVALMFLFGDAPFGYRPQTYLFFLLLALVPQLLGHSSFNWALRYLSAAFVTVTLLGEPVGSALLAYVFLDEVPTPVSLFGAILILIGIAVAAAGNAETSVETPA